MMMLNKYLQIDSDETVIMLAGWCRYLNCIPEKPVTAALVGDDSPLDLWKEDESRFQWNLDIWYFV